MEHFSQLQPEEMSQVVDHVRGLVAYNPAHDFVPELVAS